MKNALKTLAVATALTVSLSGCSLIDAAFDGDGDDVWKSQTESDPTPFDHGESDYYTVEEPAVVKYDPAPGDDPVYGDFDELERPTHVYAMLTETVDSDATARADTPGMEHNTETDIPALEGIEGSSDYRGWIYNRSHLLADSLGGSEGLENMVTGTRTQNVGSTQVESEYAGGMAYSEYAGGMAYSERIAREYLNTNDGKQCPLYYAVTPNFSGEEMIPRTVTVDIRNCDEEIDEHIVVVNTAAGHEINYTDGSFTRQ